VRARFSLYGARMHTTISRSPFGFVSLEDQQSINVVMVYEDFATGLRAKRLYDDLCRQLETECKLNQSMWKFDVLTIPRLGEAAAEEAAEANMVIVSMHGDDDLPAKVKAWMETWIREKTTSGGALVLLCDESEKESQADAVQDYLRRVADRSGLSFFADPVRLPKLGRSPDEVAPQVWSASSNHAPPTRHWGINE
jgi:hypothetical protein